MGMPAYAAQPPPVKDPAFHDFLARLIQETRKQLHTFGMQALANVMWALSNADWGLNQHEPDASEMMQLWCVAVHRRMDELRAPDVSNIATAIGRLDHRWRPEFTAAFFRTVIQRDDLLREIDVTTLNNLMFGMSRAQRRGLTRVCPHTARRLSDCITDMLRRDREAARLVPWRGAQLLYHVHKMRLRLRPGSILAIMDVAGRVVDQDPCPMDLWTFSFLVGYVDALKWGPRRKRPNLQHLYAYVERRLSEGRTSQLAMMSHAFSEMGFPPESAFWRHVFGRYAALLAPPGQSSTGQSSAPQADAGRPSPWQGAGPSARQPAPATPQLFGRGGDDALEPRTLHYLCWQAAKCGVLPPRMFLRAYMERVPPWLWRNANENQLAQAVETLRLLRWVPRLEVRERLAVALERKAPNTRLPMRALARWVRQQR